MLLPAIVAKSISCRSLAYVVLRILMPPWLGWTGIGAFILGLLISPMFSRVLPFGWDGHVAALIMNADRWGAGTALMQAGNPEAWRGLMDDFNFVKSNQAAIGTCRDAAAKAKKEQHCGIVVPAP